MDETGILRLAEEAKRTKIKKEQKTDYLLLYTR